MHLSIYFSNQLKYECTEINDLFAPIILILFLDSFNCNYKFSLGKTKSFDN